MAGPSNYLGHINRILKSAATAAASFYEGNDGDFNQDDIDQFLTFSFEEYGWTENYRGMYDDTFTTIVATFQILLSDESE